MCRKCNTSLCSAMDYTFIAPKNFDVNLIIRRHRDELLFGFSSFESWWTRERARRKINRISHCMICYDMKWNAIRTASVRFIVAIFETRNEKRECKLEKCNNLILTFAKNLLSKFRLNAFHKHASTNEFQSDMSDDAWTVNTKHWPHTHAHT